MRFGGFGRLTGELNGVRAFGGIMRTRGWTSGVSGANSRVFDLPLKNSIRNYIRYTTYEFQPLGKCEWVWKFCFAPTPFRLKWLARHWAEWRDETTDCELSENNEIKLLLAQQVSKMSRVEIQDYELFMIHSRANRLCVRERVSRSVFLKETSYESPTRNSLAGVRYLAMFFRDPTATRTVCLE